MVDRRIGTPAEQVDVLAGRDRTILVKTSSGWEVRIRSHDTARMVTGIAALVIAVGTALWFWRATTLLDPCPGGESCREPSEWLRRLQFWVACAGLITGPAIVAYLGRFAIEGRIWRHSRRLALAHALLVFAWLVVWSIGALTV